MTDDVSTLGTGKKRTVGLHRGAKSLLRNVIRHTDSHNRTMEESEMWQLYYRMKDAKPNDTDDKVSKKKTSKVERSRDGRGCSSDEGGTAFRDPNIHNSFLYDDRRDMRLEGGSRRGIKRAHMDDSSDEDRRNASASSKSTFWMRQLHKAEDADPERWGHAGFKELYPDAYNSDRSVTSDRSHQQKLKKKKHGKKRHKHKSLTKKKKQKKTDSEIVKKKKKKKKSYKGESDKERRRTSKREKSSDKSDDDSADNSRIDKKVEEMRNSIEVSESDKDSGDESERKRGRRNMKTESEREKKIAREASVERRRKKRRKH